MICFPCKKHSEWGPLKHMSGLLIAPMLWNVLERFPYGSQAWPGLGKSEPELAHAQFEQQAQAPAGKQRQGPQTRLLLACSDIRTCGYRKAIKLVLVQHDVCERPMGNV